MTSNTLRSGTHLNALTASRPRELGRRRIPLRNKFCLTSTALALAIVGSLTVGGEASPTLVHAAGMPAANYYKHIIVLALENHDYKQVVGSSTAPYYNSLVKNVVGNSGAGKLNVALATNFTADNAIGGSLQNYLDVTAGQNTGSNSSGSGGGDCNGCEFRYDNVFGDLAKAGVTETSYEDQLTEPTGALSDPLSSFTKTGPCLSTSSPAWVQCYDNHHDPAMHFCTQNNEITVAGGDAGTSSYCNIPLGGSSTCKMSLTHCNVTVFDNASPMSWASLPTFSWITPDACNDAHSRCAGTSTLNDADNWMKANLGKIDGSAGGLFGSTLWKTSSSPVLLEIWFDQGSGPKTGYATTNRVPVLFVANDTSIKNGASGALQDATPYCGIDSTGPPSLITGCSNDGNADTKFDGHLDLLKTNDDLLGLTGTTGYQRGAVTGSVSAGNNVANSYDMAGMFTGGTATTPAVSSLDLTTGTTAGGDTVNITGTGFTATSDLFFGSMEATSFVVNSDTSITAVDPSGSAGTVNTTVENGSGTSSTGSGDLFTYSTTGKYTPALTTAASPTTGVAGTGIPSAGATATLTSANSPTGSITFTLYSDSACATAVAGVSGAGTISGGTASYSTSWTPPTAQTFYWGASYAGDANNVAVSECDNGDNGQDFDVSSELIVAPSTCPTTPKALTMLPSAGPDTDTTPVQLFGKDGADGFGQASCVSTLTIGHSVGFTWVSNTEIDFTAPGGDDMEYVIVALTNGDQTPQSDDNKFWYSG